MNNIEMNRLLSEIAQHAVESFGPKLESVVLYGSYARNEADA